MKLQSTGDEYHNIQPITIELNSDKDLYEFLELIQQLQERAAEIATAMVKEKGRQVLNRQ